MGFRTKKAIKIWQIGDVIRASSGPQNTDRNINQKSKPGTPKEDILRD